MDCLLESKVELCSKLLSLTGSLCVCRGYEICFPQLIMTSVRSKHVVATHVMHLGSLIYLTSVCGHLLLDCLPS